MKKLIFLFALLISTVGFSQIEVKAEVKCNHKTLMISIDDYLGSDLHNCDLYFKHALNTNWIKLDRIGRKLLKYYIKKDEAKGIDSSEYIKFTRHKYHKCFVIHKSEKTEGMAGI